MVAGYGSITTSKETESTNLFQQALSLLTSLRGLLSGNSQKVQPEASIPLLTFEPQEEDHSEDLTLKAEALDEVLLMVADMTTNDFSHILVAPQTRTNAVAIALLAYAYALEKHINTGEKSLDEEALFDKFEKVLVNTIEEYKQDLHAQRIYISNVINAATYTPGTNPEADGNFGIMQSSIVDRSHFLTEAEIEYQAAEKFSGAEEKFATFLQSFRSYQFLILRLFNNLPEDAVYSIFREVLQPELNDEMAFEDLVTKIRQFAKEKTSAADFADFISNEVGFFNLFAKYLTTTEVAAYYQRYPQAEPLDLTPTPAIIRDQLKERIDAALQAAEEYFVEVMEFALNASARGAKIGPYFADAMEQQKLARFHKKQYKQSQNPKDAKACNTALDNSQAFHVKARGTALLAKDKAAKTAAASRCVTAAAENAAEAYQELFTLADSICSAEEKSLYQQKMQATLVVAEKAGHIAESVVFLGTDVIPADYVEALSDKGLNQTASKISADAQSVNLVLKKIQYEMSAQTKTTPQPAAEVTTESATADVPEAAVTRQVPEDEAFSERTPSPEVVQAAESVRPATPPVDANFDLGKAQLLRSPKKLNHLPRERADMVGDSAYGSNGKDDKQTKDPIQTLGLEPLSSSDEENTAPKKDAVSTPQKSKAAPQPVTPTGPTKKFAPDMQRQALATISF